MDAVNGGVLHQLSQRHRVFLGLTKREFDIADQIFIFQFGQELAHIRFYSVPCLRDRFDRWEIDGLKTRPPRRAAATIKPAGFSAQDVNHCIPDGFITPSHRPCEFLRRKLRNHIKEFSVSPMAVVIQIFQILDSHLAPPRKIPGYASLPACSLGERPIDRNQSPPNLRRSVARSGSYKFVFRRDCTLEAMRTQGAFSFFQGVATRSWNTTRLNGSLPPSRPIALSSAPSHSFRSETDLQTGACWWSLPTAALAAKGSARRPVCSKRTDRSGPTLSQ